jgi:hypothetical protein
MIKKFFLTTIFLCSVLTFSKLYGAVIKGVVGLNVDCGTACQPIPLSTTVLCNGSGCPTDAVPSLIDEQRFWASTVAPNLSANFCTTSADGGITWNTCATQPFSGTTAARFVGAADGAVIGVSKLSFPDRTIIVRSVNNGVTWSTVYTDTVNRYGGVATGRNSDLRCFLDGYCFVVSVDSVDSHFFVLESTNNGQTWSVAFTKNNNDPPGTFNSSFAAVAIKSYGDHTVVSAPGSSSIFDVRGMMKLNNIWAVSATLPTGSDIICKGSFIFNNVPYGMCYDNNIAHRVIMNIASGIEEKFPTFNPPTLVTTQGGMSLGFDSTTIYSLQNVQIGNNKATGIYVSRDSGSSFAMIFSQINVNNNLFDVAEFWKHPINGCLYWNTESVPGGNMFGRIC